jgi:hypothetical protein
MAQLLDAAIRHMTSTALNHPGVSPPTMLPTTKGRLNEQP